jgi:hypothetical protein
MEHGAVFVRDRGFRILGFDLQVRDTLLCVKADARDFVGEEVLDEAGTACGGQTQVRDPQGCFGHVVLGAEEDLVHADDEAG